jgi:hypothetical protein
LTAVLLFAVVVPAEPNNNSLEMSREAPLRSRRL